LRRRVSIPRIVPPKVYIDGHVGTTGLRIRDWLAHRRDLEIVAPPEEYRKDPAARRRCLAEADIAVLCLPDDASREAATWAGETRLIDASTAHRTAEGWTFGLPELAPGQRDLIRGAGRVSNPGCYASAFILLLRPLLDAGIVPADAALTVHALSGYSGGGRSMIERWEDAHTGLLGLPFEVPYALERVHKHVAEMMHHTGLRCEPQFVPAVGPFRCGMRLQVPLPAAILARGNGAGRIADALSARYADSDFVAVQPVAEGAVDERHFDPRGCNDTNRIELHVLPHPSGHVLLMAILDNLGKGAAGVAIQNLNLMLGLPEATGLRLRS
jgi:N-acetyl-gamma-glutamyl-phosphate reductase